MGVIGDEDSEVFAIPCRPDEAAVIAAPILDARVMLAT
jgi:hypothetical protein